MFGVRFTIPASWPFLIPYLIFILFDTAPENGGRPSRWFREWFVFRWFAKYFPVTLHKTMDLDPSRRYLFGYHPHGIFGLGAVNAFATEGCGFSKLFPGITPHLLTLRSNFNIPFYRDFLMAAGCASVSRKSCINILNKKPGNSITIVVGGAQESLAAHAGYMGLTLKARLGFVKVALRTGADLVPVLGFCENDIFDQAENKRDTWLYWVQQQLKRLLGFTTPIFIGRGFFHPYYGWMPYRVPIHVVVGKPIPVEKKHDFTMEEVHALHDTYVKALFEMWDAYKDTYAPYRITDMRLLH
ncbi:hypothetical protein MNAN1_001078 [Malassezia nana]|uniref:diacylglycerol O-acyltransferase n=1 Tax=Malassezia nana TaxID=180528 RepID=A0AAF0EKM4_9BASI|nr:hypothetical protein MNAN1_001078 [Malassezia nana]